LLPEPLPKANFTLTTTAGEPFDFRAETDGYVTLLFFGYTYCPDICPVHMANLAAALSKLPPQTASRIKVVMVTVDPERDTPERLRSWLDNFDRSFVGLFGLPEELAAIQQALYLPVAVKQGEGADYTVGHSTAVLAFTADGAAHVRYPSGTRQSDWAHDLPLLVEGEWEAP
jgi:protein SCO1/2